MAGRDPRSPESMRRRVVRFARERYTPAMQMDALPGGTLIREGLEDLDSGRETEASLLVLIGSHRLRRLGLSIPEPPDFPEHRLYERLRDAHGDGAHSRYNALIRLLVSFERAAECAK